MSLLTGRHSGSFEFTWEQDIRRIDALGAAAYLKQIEESDLSDAFWSLTLHNNLETRWTRQRNGRDSNPRALWASRFQGACICPLCHRSAGQVTARSIGLPGH